MVCITLLLFLLLCFQSETDFPRIIWSYHAGPMLSQVRMMFNHTVESLSEQWIFNYLTPENITLFLNKSEFPIGLNKLINANQADYYRLKLLERYGGWWIDTAMLIASPTALEEFFSRITASSAQLFACCTLQCPKKLIEVGLLYAPKHSIIMTAWVNETEIMLHMGRANYLYQTYRNGITFPWLLFSNYPFTYLYMSVYIAQQVVLERKIPRRTPLLIESADSTFYSWRQSCDEGDFHCMKNIANQEILQPHYPIMKINGYIRQAIWPEMSWTSGRNNPETIPLIYGIPLPRLITGMLIIWSTYYSVLFLQIINPLGLVMKKSKVE